MAVLKEKQRRSAWHLNVGGEAKFPIPDKAHARAALARLNQAKPPLSADQKARVKARAYRVLGIKPKERKAA